MHNADGRRGLVVEAAIGERGDGHVFWEGHLDLKNCGEKEKKIEFRILLKHK